MPLPVLDKAYTFNTNNVIPLDGGFTPSNDGEQPTNDRKELLLGVKNALMATAFWSVKISSNATTPGTGSGDNWTTIADTLWALETGTPNFSWSVWQNTVLDLEVLLVLRTNSNDEGGTPDVYISRPVLSGGSGFTGGAANARPTAPDESFIVDNEQWGWGAGDPTGKAWVFSTMVSTDGEVTRVVWFNVSEIRGFWFFERLKNPVTGMSSPEIVVKMRAVGQTGGAGGPDATYAGLHDVASSVFSPQYDGTSPVQQNPQALSKPPGIYMTSEGFNGQPCGQQFSTFNDVDGEFGFFPVGMASLFAGFAGRHGEFYDMWWGIDGNATGDSYPVSGTNLFIQINDLILPWDGTLPVVS